MVGSNEKTTAVWFMFDNHTFSRVGEVEDSKELLLQRAKRCFDKNVSGSLFCTYGGKDLRFDATYVPELRKLEVNNEKLSEFFDKLALLVQKAKRGHLPEENKEVGKEAQGLFRKFEVHRVDGTDRKGGKHHGCEYFVLDMDHDPVANQALAAYAAAVRATNPTLAADICKRYGLAETAAEQTAQVLTHEHVRAAGGIVHSDGNIFFTNIEKLNNAIAIAAGVRA